MSIGKCDWKLKQKKKLRESNNRKNRGSQRDIFKVFIEEEEKEEEEVETEAQKQNRRKNPNRRSSKVHL